MNPTHQLFAQLRELPQVEAIALGGSRASGLHDARSDYDVYLYCTEPIAEETRRTLLARYCSAMEIGNHYWECEDNCTFRDGVDLDLLHRDLDGFAADVRRVVEEHKASLGYTTCMWHNLRTCEVVFDRHGRLTALQRRFDVPYPSALRDSIVRHRLATRHACGITCAPARWCLTAMGDSRHSNVVSTCRTRARCATPSSVPTCHCCTAHCPHTTRRSTKPPHAGTW